MRPASAPAVDDDPITATPSPERPTTAVDTDDEPFGTALWAPARPSRRRWPLRARWLGPS